MAKAPGCIKQTCYMYILIPCQSTAGSSWSGSFTVLLSAIGAHKIIWLDLVFVSTMSKFVRCLWIRSKICLSLTLNLSMTGKICSSLSTLTCEGSAFCMCALNFVRSLSVFVKLGYHHRVCVCQEWLRTYLEEPDTQWLRYEEISGICTTATVPLWPFQC